jgi:hypothetical protein
MINKTVSILIISLVLISNLFAQRDGRRNKKRLERKAIQRANNLVEAVEDNVEFLNKGQLRELNQVLKKAIALTKGIVIDPIPAPIPTPIPEPLPPVRFLFAGTLQKTYSFEFDVSNTEELYLQCDDFYTQKKLTRADNISVSINFGPRKVLRNSQNWWKRLETCAELVKYAISNGLPPLNDGNNYVSGVIEETKRFNFNAITRIDLLQQCVSFMRANSSFGRFDDVVVLQNYSNIIKMRNSDTYWYPSEPENFCNKMADRLSL